MKSKKVKIEKPIIHENVLDLFGKEFKFDHAKGIAELLKNSIDAYTLEDVDDNNQVVYTLFALQKEQIKAIGVLDFVGMTRKKIDEAYKRWFDPQASKVDAEAIKKEKQTLGGHGNGGKYYLREMFKSSTIYTYRNSHLNILGFDNKQYGIYEDFDNIHASLEEAIASIDLDQFGTVKDFLFELIKIKKRFTFIIGSLPKTVMGTNKITTLIEKVTSHPQARRLIQWKKIYYVSNNISQPIRLFVPKLNPKRGFEKPFEFICPTTLRNDNEEIEMYKSTSDKIKLKLFTSEEPLKGIKYKGLNCIDFLGEVGVLANYEIHELGNYFKAFIYSEFVHGECFCPSMQDAENDQDYVKNDRSKFSDGPKRDALLIWVRKCVEEVCNKMDEQTKKEKQHHNLTQASELNKLLNKWKNRFLEKLLKDRLGGIGDLGIDGAEEPGLNLGKKKASNYKHERKRGDQGGSEKKRGSTFPLVLISSIDKDPDTGELVECDPRHTAVYQRPQDLKRAIYWINTSKKYPQHIMEKYGGSDSVRFREYLFQRYVDIIIKEYLIALGKLEVNLTSDLVTNEIDKKISDILDGAVEDLERFLFEDKYN